MKKILVSLLVLALCAPAMAATVTITDNTDCTATITVTAEGAVNIVGVALDVDVTAGGNITGATSDTATFNIYPDAAYTEELGDGYVYGEGSPVADQDAAGEIAAGNNICLCAGALNGETEPGATGSASVSFTITMDGNTTIDVSENALRGGIILVDGTGEDITNGTAGVVTGSVVCGGTTCYDRLPAADQAEFNEYITAGRTDAEMEPWCWQFQCHGDGNNATETLSKYRIYNGDLNLLLANWKLKAATADPAADFDHKDETLSKYKVYNGDLNLLLANWKLKDASLTNCPGYLAP